jgi:hypothetical protein
MTRLIFVFGSNLAGRHGAGAARWALENKGAVWGQAFGMQGDSYAIPTKDEHIETLSLERIKIFVDHFLEYAANHPHLMFQLTPIGCGLAGLTPAQIGPMFKGVTSNVMVPDVFLPYVVDDEKNELIEDLMYKSGLTASGCWDSFDDYDKAAIHNLCNLIVNKCVDMAMANDDPFTAHDIAAAFGVEE